jgi:hypothetical protein
VLKWFRSYTYRAQFELEDAAVVNSELWWFVVVRRLIPVIWVVGISCFLL